MLFVISKLVWAVARPSVLPLVLGLYGLARRRPAAPRAALLIYAAIWLLPLDQALLLPLENRVAPAALPAHLDGIVVLGGAVDTDLSDLRGLPALNSAAERMTAGAALARAHPEARLVFTGGSGAVVPGARTEAEAARQLWTSLGITNATYEDRSRNTYENATFTKGMVDPRPGQSWALVTSAAHMPRSLGIFCASGWPILPVPVGYKSAVSARLWWNTPFPERLGQLDLATREWLGLVAYRLLGRTGALFPSSCAAAPDPRSSAIPSPRPQ